MAELALAAAVWIVTHLGISSSPLRAGLVRRLGEWPYRGLYSVIAIAALVWLVLAWSAAPREVWLWEPAAWQRWVPVAVMPLALILLVAGISGANPTSVGQDARIDAPDAVTGVMRITRHPVQWAILLWALAHLFPNGDLPSVCFLATIAFTAGGGTVALDHKKARALGAAWPRFVERTSNVPWVAIVTGRNAFRPAEIGVARSAAALGLYAVLLWGHPWIAGVPAMAAVGAP